jgi:thiamine biosynthesis lipoprotein
MSAPVALSLAAMGTRFELVLCGDDPRRLVAAGEEALAEIARLDAQLSVYRAESEITWINRRAAAGPVKVEPRLFRLLERCAALSIRTGGAFDITVGPLMRAWRFVGGAGGVPPPEELDAARAAVGIRFVELDPDDLTVRFRHPGVTLDLGGYGKGYAVERALDLLRDNGIATALLHGGTSSVAALGAPPGQPAWRIGLQEPLGRVVALADLALSVSAARGKSFVANGRRYGHVMDARSGEPAVGAAAAAVVGASASECEALSTALLVLGESWRSTIAERFPGYEGFVATEAGA